MLNPQVDWANFMHYAYRPKPSTPLDICELSVQDTEISLQRPWRRATMHSLVQEVTGIDFASYGNDLEAAKAAAMSFFEGHIERHDTGTILKCPSVGHLVNEVIGYLSEDSNV